MNPTQSLATATDDHTTHSHTDENLTNTHSDSHTHSHGAGSHSHNDTSHVHTHSHGYGSDGHKHEKLDGPGLFLDRDQGSPLKRELKGFTVGIGGPVGSGKTALVLALCQKMYPTYGVCVVTNDIFTQEDALFLKRHNALPLDRIIAVESGGCPHSIIRDDISVNLIAVQSLFKKLNAQMVFVESGGDNLSAQFSRELADYTIYVIDVAGGDKIPRKGGPGVSQSDLLVINKTDLAEKVGADLKVMERDSILMRQDGPTVFAQVKFGPGMDEIIDHIVKAYKAFEERQREVHQ